MANYVHYTFMATPKFTEDEGKKIIKCAETEASTDSDYSDEDGQVYLYVRGGLEYTLWAAIEMCQATKKTTLRVESYSNDAGGFGEVWNFDFANNTYTTESCDLDWDAAIVEELDNGAAWVDTSEKNRIYVSNNNKSEITWLNLYGGYPIQNYHLFMEDVQKKMSDQGT